MSELSEEQDLLMRGAKKFLSDRAPISSLELREDVGAPGPTPLWKEMAELGWLGLMVSETIGGAGGSVADVELISECMGSVLLAPPYLASAVAAAAALMFGAPEGEAQALLGALCEGSAVPILVGSGRDGRWDRNSPSCEWTGQRVHGAMGFVEGAAEADNFVVVAYHADQPQLVLVPRTSLVFVDPQPAIVRGVWSHVRFDGAVGTPISGGWGAIDSALSHVAVAAAGWSAGAGLGLLARTTEYVSSRQAFGAPIGSYQAVQHSLADCATALAEATSLSRRAARELDAASTDARRMASIAFVRSSSALVEVSRRCHQVWGGVGFTREAHVQHFSRRAKLVQHSWGGAAHHKRVIADELRRREVVVRRYVSGPGSQEGS